SECMTIAAAPASSRRLTMSRLSTMGEAPGMRGGGRSNPRYVVLRFMESDTPARNAAGVPTPMAGFLGMRRTPGSQERESDVARTRPGENRRAGSQGSAPRRQPPHEPGEGRHPCRQREPEERARDREQPG